MITQIFGTTGTGKSAYLARIVNEAFYERGDILLELCRNQIEKDNIEFGLDCPFPDKPPIFVAPFLDVKFEYDFEKFFEPYHLNPYRLGINDRDFDVQFVPPHSIVIIPEAQRYFDSRQSGTFPPRVSDFFEKHRHQHLEIILESQRPDLIDLNIRRLTHLFIEMCGVKNETNFANKVEKTTWHTRRFTNWNAVNDYIKGTGDDYVDKPVVFNGDIFSTYNSFACAKEFMPKKRGGYDFLESYAEAMQKGIPKGFESFYDTAEPKNYRSKNK